MEIAEILNWVFGGTSIVSIVGFFIFWHQNKKLKQAEADKASSEAKQSESEAEQSDIATQMAKIELGNKYMQDTLNMVEMVKQALDKSDGNQEKILEKLDLIDKRVDNLEVNYSNLEQWANGDYHRWLAEQGRAASKKKPAKKTAKKGEPDYE